MSAVEAKRAIGLMSGTSMDGIDVAFVTTDGRSVIERGSSREYAYTPQQRRALEVGIARAAELADATTIRTEMAELERELTRWHGDAVERFEVEAGVAAELIGFHGHTVAHRPTEGWSVQLGDGATLAKRLKRPVVYDFRTADLAAGGEGAPLVPVYHLGLAGTLEEPGSCLAFLNLGGIANATVVRDGMIVSAFDCGPGNVLVDRWVQRGAGIPFDAGGAIASEGTIVRRWLNTELSKPFFERTGPRSLDRLDLELPGENDMELADGARTLARFTAEGASRSLDEYAPDLVIVCGGGRLNRTIMDDLRALVPGEVRTAEEVGLNGGAMEAEAFAYLAVRAANGDPSTFPQTTGCRAAVVGGRLAGP